MSRAAAIALTVLAAPLSHAQPFVDLLQVNVLHSGLVERREVCATLPLRLDTSGQLLIIDPYAVSWEARTAAERYQPALDSDARESMHGVGGAAAWVKPLHRGWKLFSVGLLRYHWLGRSSGASVQPGGALLLGRSMSNRLDMRAGVYASHEAFGWFVLPLLGVDWRIDDRTRLYGTLPGALTIERKWRTWLMWGASFRAYTNSFGPRGADFRRVNENPVGAYADWYPFRSIALRTEAGWCFFRGYLGGPGDALFANPEARRRGYADHALPDGPYARVVLAYRLRLDGPSVR